MLFVNLHDKGKGKMVGYKHYSKINQDNIQGISKVSIGKLARRAGVKRISAPIYEGTRNILKTFLGDVIRVFNINNY